MEKFRMCLRSVIFLSAYRCEAGRLGIEGGGIAAGLPLVHPGSKARGMAKKYRKPAAEEAKDTLAELWPGQSTELLKALHILTRDGALNADSRRKLKQVLHLA